MNHNTFYSKQLQSKQETLCFRLPIIMPVVDEHKDVDLPAQKKPKIVLEDDVQDDTGDKDECTDEDLISELCWKVWGIFLIYLEENSSDNEKDDSLGTDEDNNEEEICNLLLQTQDLVDMKPFHLSEKPLSTIESVVDMLPIVLSVVYYRKAELLLSRYYDKTDNHYDTPDGPNVQDLLEASKRYISNSLKYFPSNAATLLMAANLRRVTNNIKIVPIMDKAEDQDVGHGHDDNVGDVLSFCFGYPQAATVAKEVRIQAVHFLNNTSDLEQAESAMEYNPVPEWVESLFLNQIVGVEYMVDNDNDTDDGENDQQDNGFFSASSVEATASFMAAMLYSKICRHEDALMYLQSFAGLTHRLHPNVWNRNHQTIHPQSDNSINENNKNSTQIVKAATQQQQMIPIAFRGENGVLPPHLYQRMCEVFKPGAAFWKECDYANRGYFSFLHNIDMRPDSSTTTRLQPPTNLIDDVVLNHLLPLVQRALEKMNGKTTSNQMEEICAYEWWAHSRSNQANLGHMLHFDSDEADLQGKQEVHHPMISSVLHLTGDAASSGATIILDQTPHSKVVAPNCWKSFPQDNTYTIFPGNLLHGVLPCPGKQASLSLTSNSDDAPHRLTFMVGWKTRQVPDQRKFNDSLYGPCAPLPPKERETWVQEIYVGYDKNSQGKALETAFHRESEPYEAKNIWMETLPEVSPAWEEISRAEEGNDGAPLLKLPPSLDRRFFVSGAPQCFLESLFENDDT